MKVRESPVVQSGVVHMGIIHNTAGRSLISATVGTMGTAITVTHGQYVRET